ncbi:hypothetical protein [Halobacillus halophilus]|uniref:hypothetical protein n=1 Tax=Halobacillus halophilus TaxID=1570 RepID=UPI001CD69C6F|nr:hypothetical protein [Halobacillus halophilus]MCA1012766.1 hypothetical protein [Halobacillus halophilus]
MKTHFPLRSRKLVWIIGFASFLIVLFTLNLISDTPSVNLARSFIAFGASPLFILYANQNHLWFRKSFRWLVSSSHLLLSSAFIFFFGVLVSFEAFSIIPGGYGFFLHLFLLAVSSVIYWAPLLLSCPFHKSNSFMSRFAYFTLTTLVFFIYHEVAFYYYGSRPSAGFMNAGLAAMLITLFYIITQWANVESHTDRPTVKGYVHSLTEEKNS